MTWSIALFIPLPTTSQRFFRGGLISPKSRLVVLINSFLKPFLRFSIHQFGPFHWPISPSASSNICSPFHSAIPPFLHLPIHQTSLFFVHPSSVKSPRALITQSLLHFHLSISPQVKDWLSGRWDLLKMSLLTDWMRHCTAVLIYPSSVLQ